MATSVKVGEWTLPRLTIRDMLKLAVEDYERSRSAVLRDCDELDVDESVRIDKLDQLRKRRDHCQEVIDSAMTLSGSVRIIEAAISNAPAGERPPPVEDWSLTMDDLVRAALALLGVEFGERSDPTGNGQPVETGT